MLTLSEDGTKVNFTKFPATHEGVIDSFAARFRAVDTEFEALWEANRAVLEL